MTPLELARTIKPDFPSSTGRPFRAPDRELVERRQELGRPVPHPSRWRALALYGDGLLAYWQGANDVSRRRTEEALEIAQALGDDEALALAYLGLSRVAVDEGDHERGRELAELARAHARPVSDAMGQAPLHLQAQALRLAGDLDAAAALFEESLALNRRIGDDGMVEVELHNLGHVEIRRVNADAAERYFAEIPPADDPYGGALTKLNEAAVAFRRGDLDRARTRLDDAEAVFRRAGLDPATGDRAELDWLSEQLACAAR